MCHLIVLYLFVGIFWSVYLYANKRNSKQKEHHFDHCAQFQMRDNTIISTYSTTTATAECIACLKRTGKGEQHSCGVPALFVVLFFSFSSIRSPSFRHVDSYCCSAQRDAPHRTHNVRRGKRRKRTISNTIVDRCRMRVCCERLVVIIMRLKVSINCRWCHDAVKHTCSTIAHENLFFKCNPTHFSSSSSHSTICFFFLHAPSIALDRLDWGRDGLWATCYIQYI